MQRRSFVFRPHLGVGVSDARRHSLKRLHRHVVHAMALCRVPALHRHAVQGLVERRACRNVSPFQPFLCLSRACLGKPCSFFRYEHVIAKRQTAFLSHIYIKRSFFQDRLGTNIGKTQKTMPFFAPVMYPSKPQSFRAVSFRSHGQAHVGTPLTFKKMCLF